MNGVNASICRGVLVALCLAAMGSCSSSRPASDPLTAPSTGTASTGESPTSTQTGSTLPDSTTEAPPPPSSSLIDPDAVPEVIAMSFSDATHGWRLVTNAARTSLAVERSVDIGEHWSSTAVIRTQPLNDQVIAGLVFTSPEAGYISFRTATSATVEGEAWLLASRDGGMTWATSPVNGPVGRVVTTGDEDLVLTTCRQDQDPCTPRLLVSLDHGATWAARATLPTAVYVGDLTGSGSSILVYETGPDATEAHILRSTDHGTTWTTSPAPCLVDGLGSVSVAATTPAHLWLACASEPGAGNQEKAVYRSVDAGTSWTEEASNFHSVGAVPGDGYIWSSSLVALDDHRALLAETRGTLVRTIDGGVTWTPATGLPADQELFLRTIVFADATHGWLTLTVFSGSPDNGLYATDDGGKTWTHTPLH